MRCVILALLFAIVAGGCQATSVVYVHNASLGIDLQTAQQGTAKFAIGYDRETFGLVPKFKDKDKDGHEVGEAMTVTSVSRVHAKGISRVQFAHTVATGKAAEDLATNPGALADVAKNMFKELPEENAMPIPGGGS